MRKDNVRIYSLLLGMLLAGNLLALPVLGTETEGYEETAVLPDVWIPTAGITLDDKTPEDGMFRFRLLDEGGNLLAEAENEGQSVAFPDFSYAEAGTWIYYLKAVSDEDSQILCDRTVYTAMVEVTGESTLQNHVTWQRNGKPYAGIPHFFHYADSPNPETGDGIRRYHTLLILAAAALGSLLQTQRRRR